MKPPGRLAPHTRRHPLPREVRIIGGQWKRSKLPVADLVGLRPTPDRVRETLFNWLGQDLAGWRCLDAFAGTGVLGFEAASRGAAEVTLLEREARLLRPLRETAARLHAEGLRVEQGDAIAYMARAGHARFELIFLDPPFGAALFEASLRAAAPLLVADGFVYLEADRPIDDEVAAGAGLVLHRRGRAGQVFFHLFRPLGQA